MRFSAAECLVQLRKTWRGREGVTSRASTGREPREAASAGEAGRIKNRTEYAGSAARHSRTRTMYEPDRDRHGSWRRWNAAGRSSGDENSTGREDGRREKMNRRCAPAPIELRFFVWHAYFPTHGAIRKDSHARITRSVRRKFRGGAQAEKLCGRKISERKHWRRRWQTWLVVEHCIPFQHALTTHSLRVRRWARMMRKESVATSTA